MDEFHKNIDKWVIRDKIWDEPYKQTAEGVISTIMYGNRCWGELRDGLNEQIRDNIVGTLGFVISMELSNE